MGASRPASGKKLNKGSQTALITRLSVSFCFDSDAGRVAPIRGSVGGLVLLLNGIKQKNASHSSAVGRVGCVGYVRLRVEPDGSELAGSRAAYCATWNNLCTRWPLGASICSRYEPVGWPAMLRLSCVAGAEALTLPRLMPPML